LTHELPPGAIAGRSLDSTIVVRLSGFLDETR